MNGLTPTIDAARGYPTTRPTCIPPTKKEKQATQLVEELQTQLADLNRPMPEAEAARETVQVTPETPIAKQPLEEQDVAPPAVAAPQPVTPGSAAGSGERGQAQFQGIWAEGRGVKRPVQEAQSSNKRLLLLHLVGTAEEPAAAVHDAACKRQKRANGNKREHVEVAQVSPRFYKSLHYPPHRADHGHRTDSNK